MTASIATDLPEPDSPTIATTSRGSIEVDALHRLERAGRGSEADGEVADFEEGHWLLSGSSSYYIGTEALRDVQRFHILAEVEADYRGLNVPRPNY